jgi:hypothetical protein
MAKFFKILCLIFLYTNFLLRGAVLANFIHLLLITLIALAED